MKKRFVMLLISCMLLSACSMNVATRGINLTKEITPTITYEKKTDLSKEKEAYQDVTMKLFGKSLKKGKNTLISPLSVLYALGMTANGADGETLAEMENLFGLSKEELNAFLYQFMKEETNEIKAANSIWINENSEFEPKKEFLDQNVSIYDAEIFKSKFDENTKEVINRWIEEKTKGRIKKMLDRIPDDAIMYLVNALTFDAEWEEPYQEYQISEKEFTTYSGEKKKVSMMYEECYDYLESEKAKGFIKPYKGERYGFACLLPNEDVDVYDYAKELNGEELRRVFRDKQAIKVITGLPEFKTEYGVEMREILNNLGVKRAFDENLAQFGSMGKAKWNLFINRVLHRTFLEVDRKGTKAAAATIVEMAALCAKKEEIPKEVILDRPFLYMILDIEQQLPIFIGVMAEIEK